MSTPAMPDKTTERIEIKDSSEFKDQDELCQKLLDIDKMCYQGLGEDDTGPVDYWRDVDLYAFRQIAVSGDKIVGYVDMTKLSEDGVKATSAGLLKEGKMLEYVDKTGSKVVKLYIVSVTVLPEFRNRGLGRLLFEKNFQKIKEDGYSIKGMYATLWSDEGDKFFKNTKQKILAHDAYGHPVVQLFL